jgi:integrase
LSGCLGEVARVQLGQGLWWVAHLTMIGHGGADPHVQPVVAGSAGSVAGVGSTGSTMPEAGTVRVVYLDADTTDALRRLRKREVEERLGWGPAYQDGGYVFARENGEPYHPDHVTKRFARLARAHRLGTTRIHSLRHLRASILLGAGAELADISKTLGHSSISITHDIYGHMQERRAEHISKQAAGAIPRRRRTV